MWIRKGIIKKLENRIATLETQISAMQKEFNNTLVETTKRILRQPEELSKELDSMDDIESFINEFLNN